MYIYNPAIAIMELHPTLVSKTMSALLSLQLTLGTHPDLGLYLRVYSAVHEGPRLDHRKISANYSTFVTPGSDVRLRRVRTYMRGTFQFTTVGLHFM